MQRSPAVIRSSIRSSSAARQRPPWLIVAVTVVLLLLVLAFVDLKPQVDQQFFFASDDAPLQGSNAIDRRFPSGSQLILSVSSSDISSDAYLERLRRLTARISSLPSITGVQSLADGPDDYKDAEKSPFWSRPLLAENYRSSNVVVLTPSADNQGLIERIERLAHEFDRQDFRIPIAGAPYVVDMIRRSIRSRLRVLQPHGRRVIRRHDVVGP